VRDGSGQYLFNFLTQVASGQLYFNYIIDGAAGYWPLAPSAADAMFGSGVVLKVTMTWDGSTASLYLNDTLTGSIAYTKPAANWTAGSVFDLGAYEYQTFGGDNV